MSLQGTIETFAVADVLRLLAATNKSGRLQVQGPSRSGTVWVDNAKVLAAETPSVGHIEGPADVLFQLLRFDRGSFRFDLDKYPPAPAEPVEIELALGEAESMLAEWRELERSIPSTDAWVSLSRELRDTSVTIDAEKWRTISAIGSGCSIASLGDSLDLGELDTFRAVDQLLQLGLVDVGSRPASAPAIEAGAGQLGAAPAPLATPSPPDAPADEGRHLESVPGAGAGSTGAPSASTANGAMSDTAVGTAATIPEPTAWPSAEAPPASAEAPPFASFSPPPAAPAPPPDTAAPKAEAGLNQPAPPAAEPAPGFAQGYAVPGAPDSSSGTSEPATPGKGDYPYGQSGYGANDYTSTSTFERTGGTTASAASFAFEAPAAAELDASATAPATDQDNGAAVAGAPPWAPAAPEARSEARSPETEAPPSFPTSASSTAPAGEVPKARVLFDAPAPPPPPAPPLPTRDEPTSPGGWSPASWFEGSMPERIAPPPPPPPPPGGPGTWGEQARGAEGGTDASVLTAPGGAAAEAGASEAAEAAPEDPANIERQLFNLSERAREAVKRSSGLFDGRSRR